MKKQFKYKRISVDVSTIASSNRKKVNSIKYSAQIKLPLIWPMLEANKIGALNIGITNITDIDNFSRSLIELKSYIEEVLNEIEREDKI